MILSNEWVKLLGLIWECMTSFRSGYLSKNYSNPLPSVYLVYSVTTVRSYSLNLISFSSFSLFLFTYTFTTKVSYHLTACQNFNISKETIINILNLKSFYNLESNSNLGNHAAITQKYILLDFHKDWTQDKHNAYL